MKNNTPKGKEIFDDIYLKMNTIDILSVDCFDTLFWRSVSKPIDIFYKCAKNELYQRNFISATKRIKAESLARSRARMTKRTNEVSIYDIFSELGLDSKITNELIEIEIENEIQNGYIYEPIYKIIKNAKEKNKKVIIVSDIYYSAPQLKRIIFSTNPDLEKLIDEVYTSSDYNTGKYNKLWEIIPQKIKAEPKKILHIGDNYNSDFITPASLGIISYHLNIFQKQVFDIEKEKEIAHTISDRNSRINNPILDPFKGILSEIDIDDPEKAIGYCLLGPLMLIFALKINQVLKQNQDKFKKIHPCFLLRDGYLISNVMRKIIDDSSKVTLLNISRATAIASSIETNNDIDNILLKYFNEDNYEKLFKQIKLSDKVLKRINALKKSEKNFDLKNIRDLMHQKKVSDEIFEYSRTERKNLINHIKNRTGIQDGDAILFIDLGYEGTAQKLLHKFIKSELKSDLSGCYLISYDNTNKTGERYGVIDSSVVDNAFMHSILGSRIAAFEMLCTQDSPSVIGYTSSGEPLFSTIKYNNSQKEITNRIQQYCINFIDKWIEKKDAFKPKIDLIEYSNYAAGELARFNYFPSKSELAVLSSYEFDLNLGTDLKGKLFDLTEAYQDMCINGIADFQDKGQLERISSQFELRAINSSYSIASFLMNRHGLNYDFSSISYLNMQIPTIFIDGDKENIINIDTILTHDGYHSLTIPLKKNRNIGILFGTSQKLIQILRIFKITEGKEPVEANINLFKLIDFDEISDCLFKINKQSLLFINSNSFTSDTTGIRIIFRPIIRN